VASGVEHIEQLCERLRVLSVPIVNSVMPTSRHGMHMHALAANVRQWRWGVLVWRGFGEDNRWANVVYKGRASTATEAVKQGGDVSAEANKGEGWQYPK